MLSGGMYPLHNLIDVFVFLPGVPQIQIRLHSQQDASGTAQNLTRADGKMLDNYH